MNPSHKYKLIIASNRSPEQSLTYCWPASAIAIPAIPPLSIVNAGEEQPKRGAVTRYATGCLMRRPNGRAERRRTTAEWEHDMQGPSDFELSRRKLLLGTAASVAMTAAPSVADAQTPVVPALPATAA